METAGAFLLHYPNKALWRMCFEQGSGDGEAMGGGRVVTEGYERHDSSCLRMSAPRACNVWVVTFWQDCLAELECGRRSDKARCGFFSCNVDFAYFENVPVPTWPQKIAATSGAGFLYYERQFEQTFRIWYRQRGVLFCYLFFVVLANSSASSICLSRVFLFSACCGRANFWTEAKEATLAKASRTHGHCCGWPRTARSEQFNSPEHSRQQTSV